MTLVGWRGGGEEEEAAEEEDGTCSALDDSPSGLGW